ncbi:caspase family protein [Myxococcota bacterium]|jgi:hypothetical protein|nr:caspase family protein [Myxococcota bacterium]
MLLALALLLGVAAAADWPDLSTPPRGSRDGGKDVALIIGIEDYAFAPDVPGARDNARDWYTWLHDSRGVQTIKILTDTDATREGIVEAAKALAARAQPGATTWVVFVGHGAPTASADDGLLVGVDAQQKATSIEARSVRRDELLGLLAGPQAQTVVVLDACFSGKTAAGALVPGLQPLKPVSARASGTATVLTAAASDQYAGALPGKDRPAFSYLVLGALWGWGDADGNGAITADEAVRYASDALFRTVNDRTQTPSLEAADGGLVLAKGAAKGPDLGAIALAGRPAVPVVAAPAAVVPVAAAAGAVPAAGGLDAAELALRGRATQEWRAIEAASDAGATDVVERVERFIQSYQGATVSAGGQTRAVEVPELVYALQARDWFQQGGADTVDTGAPAPTGGAGATCLAQGDAVLLLIAQMVNSGMRPDQVAQQMVINQTCYTTADIAWLQANGAPWEVVQAAQSLWVGW